MALSVSFFNAHFSGKKREKKRTLWHRDARPRRYRHSHRLCHILSVGNWTRDAPPAAARLEKKKSPKKMSKNPHGRTLSRTHTLSWHCGARPRTSHRHSHRATFSRVIGPETPLLQREWRKIRQKLWIIAKKKFPRWRSQKFALSALPVRLVMNLAHLSSSSLDWMRWMWRSAWAYFCVSGASNGIVHVRCRWHDKQKHVFFSNSFSAAANSAANAHSTRARMAALKWSV